MNLRLGLLLLVVGCDSKVNPPFGGDDAGMNNNDAFVLTTHDLTPPDDGAVLTLDLAGSADGPTITITSPMANAEVAYDTLTVTATIVGKNGAFIDGGSVQLLIPANTPSGFTSAPMALTAMQDTYQGQIDISAIKSGASSFTVVAADVNGKQGAASESYIHDHGPVITFIQPTAPTAHGSIYFQAEIRDTLHPLADATNVKASIHAGDNIMVTAIAGSSPLRVQGTVNFNDYSPPLDGAQLLTITASNDHGTMTSATRGFTVDNSGPDIAFVNPVPGQFIGGVLNIQATIDDISGVNDNSVIAIFGGDLSKSVKLSRVMAGKPEFEGLFDVRQLGTNYVLPTISIRADDLLGLHGEVAEEIVVDNVPPVMSLDPPNIVEGLPQTGNVIQCSQGFDPVGTDAASDKGIVQQIITLRARIEDQGNNAPGLAVIRLSGVESGSVFLYGIPAGNGALAVDTDGDGTCDDVNPELVPTTNVSASNQAVAVQMAPIPPSGAADMRATPSPPANAPPGYPYGVCSGVGTATDPPPPLCGGVKGLGLTIAIGYNEKNDPAIWTIPPVGSTATSCVGLQFDSLNRLPEGPACFVVIARDNAGNHSVSAPMRLCINRGGTACNAWPPATLPNCTGVYDKATMKTNSTTPCNPSAKGFEGDPVHIEIK